ncbi:MAG: hypothetical protein Kow00133_05950 [Amphiplicatus sp.]
MSEDAEQPNEEVEAVEEQPAKKGLPLKPILFSVGGALILGGAAAGASYLMAPMLTKCPAPAPVKTAESPEPKDLVFVAIEPMVISLGPEAQSKYLKISISIETTKPHEKRLHELTPRIRDVLNAYLRSVDESDLERPANMARLRAQMLRRLQLVAPAGSVHNVLITDFVLT